MSHLDLKYVDKERRNLPYSRADIIDSLTSCSSGVIDRTTKTMTNNALSYFIMRIMMIVVISDDINNNNRVHLII